MSWDNDSHYASALYFHYTLGTQPWRNVDTSQFEMQTPLTERLQTKQANTYLTNH